MNFWLNLQFLLYTSRFACLLGDRNNTCHLIGHKGKCFLKLLQILVHFGSFWFIWFILVHFANWVLVILVHSANWIHTIFKNFTIQKTRKHLIETKIPIIFKNLFKVIEKNKECKKLS